MKKLNFLLGLLLLTSSSLLAQQESMITFYKNHLNLVNPAYIGADKMTSLQSSIRNQWSGIKDAPSTQAVSFMTTLRDEKFSLGVSFIHDQVFIEKQSFIAIDFAYDLQLNDKLNLLMGIKAGGNNYEVNTQGLQTYNVNIDPSLTPISRFNPNIGAGFYLKHDKYFVSLSVPKMLNTDRAKNEDGFATVATDRAHFYFSTGYSFTLNENLDLLPLTMVRYVNGAPVSVDLTLTTIFNKNFQLGATYRTDKSLAGMVQFKIRPKMNVGYAYEYSSRSLLGKVNGSNELFIQFKL